MPNKTRFPPILHQGRSQCEGSGQTPGGTQLLFWYRCSAQRAANGGLKNGKAQKHWGLKNWLLEKIGLKGIVSDSNNIFLWHESEDINKKSLFPKIQLIPMSPFQVMHNYVCFIAPIDYCVE